MKTVADLQELRPTRWLPGQSAQDTRESPVPCERVATVTHFKIGEQQISGSLQDMGFPELSRDLPLPDPYQILPETNTWLFFPAGSFVTGVRHDHDFDKFAKTVESYLAQSANAVAKTLASFIGRVESFIGDQASVLLINEQTGERLESRCDTEILRDNGIGVGDEFRCEVIRSKGATITRLSRIPPKPLSKERVEQIRVGFEGRWKF
jgi:hypothetical protein